MRHLLPAVALAAATGLVAVPAAAKETERRADERKRVRSHVSLHVSRHAVLADRRVVVHGRVRPGGARRVKLVFRGRDGDVVRARSKPSGSFAVRWSPDRTGSYRIRAYGIHTGRAAGAVSPARRVTAYRRAEASYYGPGFYGGSLACGGTLQPGTIGVANKSLPCGTRVHLRYRGRSLTVRVIDRGPYIPGRDYDLTAATKSRLGFPDIGVLLASR